MKIQCDRVRSPQTVIMHSKIVKVSFLVNRLAAATMRYTHSTQWRLKIISLIAQFISTLFPQTTVASSSNSKNYQASSHSSSKPPHRIQHNNYRSSVSSHSDIFMKADDHKLNFGEFDETKQVPSPRTMVHFSILFCSTHAQIFPTSAACHHCTQRHQFHRTATPTVPISMNNSKHRARYSTSTSHAIPTCALSSAPIRHQPNTRNEMGAGSASTTTHISEYHANKIEITVICIYNIFLFALSFILTCDFL